MARILTGESRNATLYTERQLLGDVLIQSSDGDKEAIDYCRKLLIPYDFYDYQYKDPNNIHARIYRAMLACDLSPHQVSVAEKMEKLNILYSGDIAYLIGLVADNECALKFDEDAQIVKRLSNERSGVKSAVIGVDL